MGAACADGVTGNSRPSCPSSAPCSQPRMLPASTVPQWHAPTCSACCNTTQHTRVGVCVRVENIESDEILHLQIIITVLCAHILGGDDGALLMDADLPNECVGFPLGGLQVGPCTSCLVVWVAGWLGGWLWTARYIPTEYAKSLAYPGWTPSGWNACTYVCNICMYVHGWISCTGRAPRTDPCSIKRSSNPSRLGWVR